MPVPQRPAQRWLLPSWLRGRGPPAWSFRSRPNCAWSWSVILPLQIFEMFSEKAFGDRNHLAIPPRWLPRLDLVSTDEQHSGPLRVESVQYPKLSDVRVGS